ncbi:uncharacterized protein LOC114246372, partial [Bombyx mandarina]|uniref:Uncharacterized protein LOC114246372 n=1 Tax=Bombyx mandarina TaxID=7092 RepID=A0A6J2JZ07_BOMMA
MLRVVVICVCFLVIAPYGINAVSDEQKIKIREQLDRAGFECFKDHKITEDDIKKLKANKPATGENVPCFIACVMKKTGVMNDQGVIRKEPVLELAKKVLANDKDIKKLQDYIHSCSHVNEEAVGDGVKGCERAKLAYNCLIENSLE